MSSVYDAFFGGVDIDSFRASTVSLEKLLGPMSLMDCLTDLKVISDQGEIIDPGNDMDWYSLIVGWGVGKGLNYEQAHALSLFVRYSTNLG